MKAMRQACNRLFRQQGRSASIASRQCTELSSLMLSPTDQRRRHILTSCRALIFGRLVTRFFTCFGPSLRRFLRKMMVTPPICRRQAVSCRFRGSGGCAPPGAPSTGDRVFSAKG
jgi:hypothetical protein